jgi:hypothetical protein
MLTFRCACGSRIFFDNTRCLNCRRELGFLPDALTLVALEQSADGAFTTPAGQYRKCANYSEYGVCNWMVAAGAIQPLCHACQLNHVIPDLSEAGNQALWAEVERAKRRLVYSLNRLHLPLATKRDDPENGLSFDIKADSGASRVLTGHEDGLITLNLAEADPAERERIRAAMKERYRTMLGHFRHEIGHYYWDRLVRDSRHLRRFRELFGDETVSYADALKRHYAGSDTPDAQSYISSYAAAHPWEDFAETFAHYLHMVDTLETAHDFGLTSRIGNEVEVVDVRDFDLLTTQWAELTVALNALNRSMGLPDAYPFALSPAVKSKIEFVHARIAEAGARGPC